MKIQSIHSFLARLSIVGLFAITLPVYASAGNVTEIGTVRIIGGLPITIDKAPYIVQIKDDFGYFICGGTLVSDRFVVTAAHCFNSQSPKTIRIIAGATFVDGDEAGVQRRAENYWTPPEYKLGSPHMDVAVIKLRLPIKLSKTTRPVKLCKTAPKTNDTLKVAGWGRYDRHSTDNSNQLRYIVIPVMSMDECIERHANLPTKITESMMCASKPGIKDACTGDSGGPALYGGRLCGIVSWGYGCARADYAGVYTSIPAVTEFIEECMKK